VWPAWEKFKQDSTFRANAEDGPYTQVKREKALSARDMYCGVL